MYHQLMQLTQRRSGFFLHQVKDFFFCHDWQEKENGRGRSVPAPGLLRRARPNTAEGTEKIIHQET